MSDAQDPAAPGAPGASGSTYDAIVVGGGHNGLVNGAYLAKAGLRTLILERRHLVGGAAITEEPVPGFHFTTFSYALSLLRPEIIQELDLVRHGFMPLMMPSGFHPTGDGGHLLLGEDHAQNVQEIRRHSRHDADAYDRFHHDLDLVRRAVRPLFDNPPPNVFGSDPEDQADVRWLLNHLGNVDKNTMHDVARLLTGSAADWLDDYFEHDAVKGYHASSSIIGSKVGPMSQGSGLVMLFHKMGEHDGAMGAWAFHKGGNGGFTQVLARAAESFGAEIRVGAAVSSVLTDGDRTTGVVLADGTEIRATTVVSALDARRTFTELVDPRALPDDLVDAVRRTRYRGVSAKVNFALDALPTFPGLPDTVDHFGGFLNIGPTMEYVERAFDASKYGWYSDRPFIDAAVQSVVDPDMAPPGKHVMSCFVQYAPYELRGSDWETEREPFGDTAQAVLEEHFPGFGDLVLHREVVTPQDIETHTGLSEGNIFAGEFLAPQMYFFRPAPGWSQYRTPIEGYYQCGSGTHPGGCVMGSPGKLAAQRILKDRQA
ncbi:NAD(P)/FAD-dependent oxidoreductase [Nocardioides sp. HDW12B]|uniref:phytoene desaturase family protein n=1 Tax=Nocardioides sp. HDW12B TaxID=2714939 RepID=UPI00140B2584|nr:NAD(P)/FAD-dependent oxidoreductase [Nocardioides sp. HDW12B]QIK67200.1 NAD(P)/FAD-dependent oxidoreductase [Nocardioides sp. HDW12B]